MSDSVDTGRTVRVDGRQPEPTRDASKAPSCKESTYQSREVQRFVKMLADALGKLPEAEQENILSAGARLLEMRRKAKAK